MFGKSVKKEEIEVEREKSLSDEKEIKNTPASNICEALGKMLMGVNTKRKDLFMWTAARIKRLKKEFIGHQEKQAEEEKQ